VLRKDDDDWVKKRMEYGVEGSRPRGRPKSTWKQVVREDCRARKLNKEDAMDRCKSRKVIKEYVDQDGCERVNVSSGTGLPGLSRTNGRQMVVVVTQKLQSNPLCHITGTSKTL